MTITVDISPEVEAELARKAAARGIDVPAYVATLIEQAARPEESGGLKYQRPAGRKSLAQLFAESPFAGLDIDFERDGDTGADPFPGAAAQRSHPK